MFIVIAALVFATALALSVGTMAFMFTAYHDKMVAALLYKPEAEAAPVYHVTVRRIPAVTLAPVRLVPRAPRASAPLPLAA